MATFRTSEAPANDTKKKYLLIFALLWLPNSPSIRIFQNCSNALSIVELYGRRDSFLSVGVDLGGPIGLVLCVIIIPPLRGKFVKLEVFSVYGDPSLVRHNSVV